MDTRMLPRTLLGLRTRHIAGLSSGVQAEWPGEGARESASAGKATTIRAKSVITIIRPKYPKSPDMARAQTVGHGHHHMGTETVLTVPRGTAERE
jgi:hypothetical protein